MGREGIERTERNWLIVNELNNRGWVEACDFKGPNLDRKWIVLPLQ